ncbi:MAG: hypothetical protein HQ596_06330 [Candidatus Saganbacteria bacterium]|nr:hypothetical protein [Candidatus Saganbacteria bacterium]
MRYLIVLLIGLSLLLGGFSTEGYAKKGRLTPRQRAKIKARVHNLTPAQKEQAAAALRQKMIRLENASEKATAGASRALIEADLERVQVELGLIAPPPMVKPLRPKPPLPPGKKPLPPKAQLRGPRVAVSVGYLAGMIAAQGELRYFEPFGLTQITSQIGAAYAQGEDSDKVLRKHALIILGGAYNLNPPKTSGLRSYIGVAANYDAYTTGKVSGTFGGEAYYGLEGGAPKGGKTFFEVGYGTIRTGFSPDYTGVIARLGYKF